MKKSLYKMIATQGLSLIGTRMTAIALGIWLFKTTGKATALLLIPFFNELPTLFLAYFGGVIIDRVSRKKLLVLTDLGQALGTLLLLISIYFSFFHIAILFAVVFIQGLFVMVQEPAADSTIGWLTDDENRDKTNGIKEMLFPAAGILGPAITGILYPFIGLEGILIVDLLTFAIAASVLSTIVLPDIEETDREAEEVEATSFKEDSRVGLAYLKRNRGLLALIIYFSLSNFLLNGPLELIIPIGLSTFESEGMVSALLMTMSMATFVGAFLVGHLPTKKGRVPLIFVLMSLNGLMLIGFGISMNTAMLFVTLFFAMMPLPMVSTYFKSILQKKVPKNLQGRVFSLSYQIAYGSAPLSFIIVGPLVDRIFTPLLLNQDIGFLSKLVGSSASSGMKLTFIIAGVLILLTTLSASLVKSVRRIEQ